jgi:hypothetical protein
VRVLENRFTWSKSRADAFSTCLRKYWWTYYGAWGGWSADAPREAREAYVLKSLHSRWTWVGQVVHSTIERLLRRTAREKGGGQLSLGDGGGIDAEKELEAVTSQMRAQYRESLDGRYRADPKRAFGLLEHEYAEAVPATEWKEMNRRALDAVSRFVASPTFASIRATDPATWLPFETLDSFEFEGTPIWVALDFARRTPEGAEVFDWKTGGDRVDENRLQVLGYALFLEARYGIPARTVTCRLVYVNTGTVYETTPTDADLDAARAEIRASIGEMRRRLRDPAANAAEMLAFPMTEDAARCGGCCYRRLCGRG